MLYIAKKKKKVDRICSLVCVHINMTNRERARKRREARGRRRKKAGTE